jgi:hypothetical protein
MMLGKAAVAMWCDVALDVKEEFDDWHAHEHQPERLSIPGFLRGSRWASTDGRNSYVMLYETQNEATVTTGPYLERLNNPTPWSRKMMAHHKNMVRSLCRVQASFGSGIGQFLRTARFAPEPAQAEALERRLAELLPSLPSRKGIVAAHLLRRIASSQAGLTTEQKMRGGGDGSADWIVMINGYDAGALCAVDLPGAVSGIYNLACMLTPADLDQLRAVAPIRL